jgi:hypothetical protein
VTLGRRAFYVEALRHLERTTIPFLVGGTFAFARYVHIDRETKDLDIFIRPEDVPRTLALFRDLGYGVDLPFPHWLGKVHHGGHFLDLVFSSGNGVARVDDHWFDDPVEEEILGLRLPLCPPEEMIWSKAFVQERERFDGADVLHLLRELGLTLDWPRLLVRFGPHWPVLFSHIVLFGFVYPDQRHCIPEWIRNELTRRFAAESSESSNVVCNGTLLSREQYLYDLEHLGYSDARIEPIGRMTREETGIWTAAIGDHEQRLGISRREGESDEDHHGSTGHDRKSSVLYSGHTAGRGRETDAAVRLRRDPGHRPG